MTTTRATSKLEEQLATLLEKVDQQEANMETRMDRLVAKLDDQEAQLKLLAGQAARIDAVSTRQVETERGVEAIQADLRSVKTTMDERLTNVEGSLTGTDRRWKAELVEREERADASHSQGDLALPTKLKLLPVCCHHLASSGVQ